MNSGDTAEVSCSVIAAVVQLFPQRCGGDEDGSTARFTEIGNRQSLASWWFVEL